MISIVWDGDQPVNQDWGCTTVVGEPWSVLHGCYWHCGMDIGDPQCLGKPIYAARDGVVSRVGPGILGIQVAISAQPTDYYIHIASCLVKVGDKVQRGQHVATFGNVSPAGGFTTGPHLHFETQASGGGLNWPNATNLDPHPVLSAVFGPSDRFLGVDMSADAERKIDELHEMFIPEGADNVAPSDIIPQRGSLAWLNNPPAWLKSAIPPAGTSFDPTALIAAVTQAASDAKAAALAAQAAQTAADAASQALQAASNVIAKAAGDITAIRAQLAKDMAP